MWMAELNAVQIFLFSTMAGMNRTISPIAKFIKLINGYVNFEDKELITSEMIDNISVGSFVDSCSIEVVLAFIRVTSLSVILLVSLLFLSRYSRTKVAIAGQSFSTLCTLSYNSSIITS